jgi:hypothetical protein
MKRVLGLLLYLSSQQLMWAGADTALIAEDGSGLVGRWYYSKQESYIMRRPGVLAALEQVAKEHSFELFDVGRVYEWMQDVSLFDESGGFIVQADYPYNQSTVGSDPIFEGLSMGVYGEDNTFYRIDEAQASQWTSVSRIMQTTFIEGGELISGRRSSGEPYAILDELVLARAKAFQNRYGLRDVSDHEVRQMVAADLGVSAENLVALKAPRHLDLFMLALPGGKILLQDPRMVPVVIQEILDNKSTSSTEAERLKNIRNVHIQALVANSQFHNGDLYNQAAEVLLSSGFEVVRVAGDFSEIQSDGIGEKESRINFMNSFQGTDPQGRHWMVSSPADGIPHLETYWTNLLQAHANAPYVYFIGEYNAGAGMDCVGAIAGR